MLKLLKIDVKQIRKKRKIIWRMFYKILYKSGRQIDRKGKLVNFLILENKKKQKFNSTKYFLQKVGKEDLRIKHCMDR